MGSLLFTPHLPEPNRNQLDKLVYHASDKRRATDRYMASLGLSRFRTEWLLVQYVIHAAMANLGINLELSKHAEQDVASLRSRITSRTNILESIEKAEFHITSGIIHASSHDTEDWVLAIQDFREASAIYDREGLYSAAAMVWELACQTGKKYFKEKTIINITKEALCQTGGEYFQDEIDDHTLQTQIASDHYAATSCWHKTLVHAPLDSVSHGMRIFRGINNGLRAENFDGVVNPGDGIINSLLVLSADWYSKKSDPQLEKELQSLLYYHWRRLQLAENGTELTSDDWEDIAKTLHRTSKIFEGKKRRDVTENAEWLANSAYYFATLLLAKSKR
ncbi:MAG: hypothetical protein ABH871_00200 [Pseudomonadota bacterium]